MVAADFAERGWVRFPAQATTLAWVAAAAPLARQAIADSSDGWRCGGTWWVGLDALPNDPDGAVAGVPLLGAALRLAIRLHGRHPLHRAQLSTIRPGYPQRDEDETDAAFAYRQRRDAAHVDGLLAVGPGKRRMVREPHAFILGIALNAADPAAAPLTVWDGSHRIVGRALRRALAAHDPAYWSDVDVTEPYQAARRETFAACRRATVPLRPGEAVLLHRHLLHGVAPWADGAQSDPEGRVIAYFRPQLASVADWAGE